MKIALKHGRHGNCCQAHALYATSLSACSQKLLKMISRICRLPEQQCHAMFTRPFFPTHTQKKKKGGLGCYMTSYKCIRHQCQWHKFDDWLCILIMQSCPTQIWFMYHAYYTQFTWTNMTFLTCTLSIYCTCTCHVSCNMQRNYDMNFNMYVMH